MQDRCGGRAAEPPAGLAWKKLDVLVVSDVLALRYSNCVILKRVWPVFGLFWIVFANYGPLKREQSLQGTIIKKLDYLKFLTQGILRKLVKKI